MEVCTHLIDVIFTIISLKPLAFWWLLACKQQSWLQRCALFIPSDTLWIATLTLCSRLIALTLHLPGDVAVFVAFVALIRIVVALVVVPHCSEKISDPISLYMLCMCVCMSVSACMYVCMYICCYEVGCCWSNFWYGVIFFSILAAVLPCSNAASYM